MNDKEQIFANIKAALHGVDKTPRPDLDYERFIARRRLEDPDLWADFKVNFEGVRGKCIESIDTLAAFLKEQDCLVGYCDPALRDSIGEPLSEHLEVAYAYTREQVDDLKFGITRGSAVVAETGSILLKDRDTSNRLAALAPWAHIAVVPREAIYPTVREAVLAMDDDPNIIWVTGPSKTADIEGILIEGVHGPGEQVCFPV